jgi:hypothetical protein
VNGEAIPASVERAAYAAGGRVQFEARVLADSKVGFRVPVPHCDQCDTASPLCPHCHGTGTKSAAAEWVVDLLASLKKPDAPTSVTLRKLGAGPTGGMQVTPVIEPATGDLILEGLDLLHEGRPGDDHWYVTLKVARARTQGETVSAPPVDAGALLHAVRVLHEKLMALPVSKTDNDGHVSVGIMAMSEILGIAETIGPMLDTGVAMASPDTFQLLAAIKDGKIIATASTNARGVAIRFVDADSGEGVEIIAATGAPETAPDLKGDALGPEVSEVSLQERLVKILTEEHEATREPMPVTCFRDRIFARILALVDPVSASPAQAHAKAAWFVAECMKVFERKRMDRQDIVDLVAAIATGRGMRG